MDAHEWKAVILMIGDVSELDRRIWRGDRANKDILRMPESWSSQWSFCHENKIFDVRTTGQYLLRNLNAVLFRALAKCLKEVLALLVLKKLEIDAMARRNLISHFFFFYFYLFQCVFFEILFFFYV